MPCPSVLTCIACHQARLDHVFRSPACATVAAERSQRVTLFETSDAIRGQFNVARRIPGKATCDETLCYICHRIAGPVEPGPRAPV